MSNEDVMISWISLGIIIATRIHDHGTAIHQSVDATGSGQPSGKAMKKPGEKETTAKRTSTSTNKS
jgi:hypothetical protein